MVGVDIAAADGGGIDFYQHVFRADGGHINISIFKALSLTGLD
jgi:hypothetical protein